MHPVRTAIQSGLAQNKILDSRYSVVVKYNTKQPERTMNAGVLQER